MSYDKIYMNKEPIIHILPQDAYHDPAAIIGNKKGLTQLRDLLSAILAGAEVVTTGYCTGGIQVFCNDGEGYNITAAVRPDMSDVPCGYTYDMAKDNTPFPEWLIEAIRNNEQ